MPQELGILTELQIEPPLFPWALLRSQQVREGWHLLLCFYTTMGFHPQSLPFEQYPNTISVSTMWCHEITEGLWLEKKGWMWWGLPSYSHLSLSSQSVSECLVFTNCKFQDFGYCFARPQTEATDKVQHRHADYQLFPQTTGEIVTPEKTLLFFGLFTFQKVGTFPIKRFLKRHSGLEENKALLLCYPVLGD